MATNVPIEKTFAVESASERFAKRRVSTPASVRTRARQRKPSSQLNPLGGRPD